MFKRNKKCSIFVEIDKIIGIINERITRKLMININQIYSIEPLMRDDFDNVCCELKLINGDKIIINESYSHFIKRLGVIYS